MYRRFLAILGLCLIAVATFADQTRLQDLDARLDTAITLEMYGRPLGEVAQVISRRIGARIQVSRDIREQKVMIAVDQVPARQILEVLTSLFGYELTTRVGRSGQTYLLEAGKSKSERRRQIEAYLNRLYERFAEGYRLMRRASSPGSPEHKEILEVVLASVEEGTVPDRVSLSRQIAAVYQFATSFSSRQLFTILSGEASQRSIPWAQMTLRQQRSLARALALRLPPTESDMGILAVAFDATGQIWVDYVYGGASARISLSPSLLTEDTLERTGFSSDTGNGSSPSLTTEDAQPQTGGEGEPAQPEPSPPAEDQVKPLSQALRELRASKAINLIADYYQRYDYALPELLEKHYGYLRNFTSTPSPEAKSDEDSLQEITRPYLCRTGEPAPGLVTLRSRSWFLDDGLEIPAGLLDVLLDPETLLSPYVALDVRSQAASALEDRRLSLLASILKEEFEEINDLEANAPFYRFYATLAQPQRATLLFSQGLLLEDITRPQLALLEQVLTMSAAGTWSDTGLLPGSESPVDPQFLAGVALLIDNAPGDDTPDEDASSSSGFPRIAYQLRSLSFVGEYHGRILRQGVVSSPAKPRTSQLPAAPQPAESGSEVRSD